MTKILIYDVEAERIDKICNELDVSEAEVIEALFNILDYYDEDIAEHI